MVFFQIYELTGIISTIVTISGCLYFFITLFGWGIRFPLPGSDIPAGAWHKQASGNQKFDLS